MSKQDQAPDRDVTEHQRSAKGTSRPSSGTLVAHSRTRRQHARGLGLDPATRRRGDVAEQADVRGDALQLAPASNAANKAFITNRIGDAGFIIGMLILWTHVGTLNFVEMFAKVRGPI